jgi:hypothetical protein
MEVGKELLFGPPKTKRSRRAVSLPRRIVTELEAHLRSSTGAGADALVFLPDPMEGSYDESDSAGCGGNRRRDPSDSRDSSFMNCGTRSLRCGSPLGQPEGGLS